MPKNKLNLKSLLLGSVPFVFQLLLLALTAFAAIKVMDWRVTIAEGEIQEIKVEIEERLIPRTEFDMLKESVNRIDGNVNRILEILAK